MIRSHQKSLWGDTVINKGIYYVYHDESIPNKRWLLIGLLFIEKQDVDIVKQNLKLARKLMNYWGEIHFSKLPKRFDGKYGAKARVAREWIKAYESRLREYALCSILAVDRHSPAYHSKRFPKDFYAYNRFTAMALKASVAWLLGPRQHDEIEIIFVSDKKYRQSRPQAEFVDNFEDYIPFRAELDSFLAQYERKKYPLVRIKELVLSDSVKEDLLQLCDLLLGATQMALVCGSKRETKIWFGQRVAIWQRDLMLPPWEQTLGLYRKFNLWAFPDADGKPYNNITLALKVNNEYQLSLFP